MRTHTKSRTGCKTCKNRRVKCDETGFPECLNCTKRELECVWPASVARSNQIDPLSPSLPSLPDDSLPTSASSSKASTSFTRGHDPRPSTPSTSSLLPTSSYPVLLDMSILELMHHYTRETSVTIAGVDFNLNHNPLRHVYQVSAPKLALSHPLLMHSILALAALHLHAQNRDSLSTVDYYSRSFYHNRQARRQNVSPICPDGACSPNHTCIQTASALFLGKLFINMHSFLDTLCSRGKQPSVLLDSLIDWMEEQRTVVASFLGLHSQKLHNGPLAARFFPLTTSSQDANNIPGPPFPPSLLTLHRIHAGAPDDSELFERDVSNTYREVVTNLERLYQSFHEGPRMRALFIWASLASNCFIRLLRQKRPRALILLAHFCSLYQDQAQKWSDQPPASPFQTSQSVHNDVWDDMRMHWWMKDVNDIVLAIRSAMPNEQWRMFLDATLLEGRAFKGMEGLFNYSQHQYRYPSLPSSPVYPQPAHRGAHAQSQQGWDQNALFNAHLYPHSGYASGTC